MFSSSFYDKQFIVGHTMFSWSGPFAAKWLQTIIFTSLNFTVDISFLCLNAFFDFCQTFILWLCLNNLLLDSFIQSKLFQKSLFFSEVSQTTLVLPWYFFHFFNNKWFFHVHLHCKSNLCSLFLIVGVYTLTNHGKSYL